MNVRNLIHDTYDRTKALFVRVIKRFKYLTKIAYYFTGKLLLVIGSAMIGKKSKYLLIIETIENLYSSLDVRIKVQGYYEEPLFVRFTVEIKSSVDHLVDWKYFTTELIYQIGCNLSDIVINLNTRDSGKNKNIYTIDITKTAITNLEKGTSPGIPHVFEETNTDVVMQKAIELSKTEIITPYVLEQKLGINSYRADTIYNQLIQAGILAKKRNQIIVN